MKAVTGSRLAKLAEGKGWRLARINGSLHIFIAEGRTERLVIPIHGNGTLKIGLQSNLMKMIPLAEADWLSHSSASGKASYSSYE